VPVEVDRPVMVFAVAMMAVVVLMVACGMDMASTEGLTISAD